MAIENEDNITLATPEMTPQEREHVRSKAIRILNLSKSQANELTTNQIRMLDEMMRESMKPTADQEMRFRLVEDLKWKKFPVLDDGFVCLVDVMGDDDAVVQAARVSYAQDKREGQAQESPRQLIRYLMRHRHTTPFEMAEVKILVRVPMDTWRQWIRHRTASVNEYSTRYTVAIDACQTTPPDQWRLQSGTNKQGSSGLLVEAEDVVDTVDEGGRTRAVRVSGRERAEDHTRLEKAFHYKARQLYEARLADGIAREQARKDLPLSTYTEAYWKIDLHNILHFLGLRMDSHAQKEIRDYATTIGEQIIKPLFPIVWEAFEDYRLGAMSLTRLDIMMIQHFMDKFASEPDFDKHERRAFFLEECKHDAFGNGFVANGWDKEKCRERDECRAKLERLGLL